jgi:cytoskeletal protein CcmA (bactofilin family)
MCCVDGKFSEQFYLISDKCRKAVARTPLLPAALRFRRNVVDALRELRDNYRVVGSVQRSDPWAPDDDPTPSLLGARRNRSAGRRGRAVTIIGKLRTEGDVQIDGHLSGNFNCAQLIVGRDADVTGAIIANEVVVRGKITGTIRATRIVLEYTARVESEIVYKLLSIDEGARFEGVARCRPNPLQDQAAVRH